MYESDEKYYKRKEIEKNTHNAALSKARNRGIACLEWERHNKLTPKTLPALKEAMKKADQEWESRNS